MKMQKIKYLLLTGMMLSMMVLNIQAQDKNEEVRYLENFNQLEVEGALTVMLKQSDENKIQIFSSDGNTSNIETNINNDILTIKRKKGAKKLEDAKITVYFKNLENISVEDAVEIYTASELVGKKLELNLSGAAAMNLQVQVDELKTRVSGAGDLKLAGIAKLHQVQINGAGNIKAYELETDTTDINVSGAGDARINASQFLKVSISGAGNVLYKEEPIKKTIEISGAGYCKKATAKNLADASDTTKLKLGKSKIYIFEDEEDNKPKKNKKSKKFDGNWDGIDLGINNYIDRFGRMDAPAGYDFLELKENKSLGFGLNLFEQNINLYNQQIGLVTGLGFRWNNYRLQHNVRLISDSAVITAYTDTVFKYNKNKLTATYLTFPLLLEFQTAKNRHDKCFHFGFGGQLGIKLASHIKQVYDDGNRLYKNKNYDDYHLNPFQADAVVRFGWGPINLFASYSLLPLFEKREGPEIFPIMAGITLVSF